MMPFEVSIRTADVEGAGTDGRVWIKLDASAAGRVVAWELLLV